MANSNDISIFKEGSFGVSLSQTIMTRSNQYTNIRDPEHPTSDYHSIFLRYHSKLTPSLPAIAQSVSQVATDNSSDSDSDSEIGTTQTNYNNFVSDVQINKSIVAAKPLFQFLERLAWKDKDEAKCDVAYFNKARPWWKDTYGDMLKTLAGHLEGAIRRTAGDFFRSMSLVEKNNFLFHAVAKGQAFYAGCITEPDFALYLQDQYQPLYTLLNDLNLV